MLSNSYDKFVMENCNDLHSIIWILFILNLKRFSLFLKLLYSIKRALKKKIPLCDVEYHNKVNDIRVDPTSPYKAHPKIEFV